MSYVNFIIPIAFSIAISIQLSCKKGAQVKTITELVEDKSFKVIQNKSRGLKKEFPNWHDESRTAYFRRQFGDLKEKELPKKLSNGIVKGAKQEKGGVLELRRRARRGDDKYKSINKSFRATSGLVHEFETFILIPKTDDEFISMFKRYNARQAKKIKSSAESLERLPNTKILKTADKILDGLNGQSNKNVILIGHNQDGIIMCPDGSGMSIEKIDEIAKRNDQVVIFLSCKASKYTNGPSNTMNITYEQAAKIQEYIRSGMYSKLNKDKLAENLQLKIDEMEQEFGWQFKLKVAALTGAGSSTVGGLYIVKRKNSK